MKHTVVGIDIAKRVSFSEAECTNCQKCSALIEIHYRASNFSPSLRSVPLGETCRYKVCRVMPSSWHRSLTLVSDCPMAAMASLNLADVILNALPPLPTPGTSRGQSGDSTLRNQFAFKFC